MGMENKILWKIFTCSYIGKVCSNIWFFLLSMADNVNDIGNLIILFSVSEILYVASLSIISRRIKLDPWGWCLSEFLPFAHYVVYPKIRIHFKNYFTRGHSEEPMNIDKANKIINDFGQVDFLINNAAIERKVETKVTKKNSSRLENFLVNDWDKEFEVGVTGAFICTHIIGSHMAECGKGVIINIGSDLSFIAPNQSI